MEHIKIINELRHAIEERNGLGRKIVNSRSVGQTVSDDAMQRWQALSEEEQRLRCKLATVRQGARMRLGHIVHEINKNPREAQRLAAEADMLNAVANESWDFLMST